MAASVGRYRWFVVVGLLFLISVINFGDRGVLGVVGPVLVKLYHLSPVQFGLIGSAFGFGYCAMQLLGSGTLVRWVQPRRLIVISGILWSLFIGLMTTAAGFVAFFIYRLLFGLSEGTNWMSMETVLSRWFSRHETQMAFNFVWAGISVSSIVVPPIAVALVGALGWRGPFWVLAAAGIVVAVLFGLLVSEWPEQNRRLSSSERDYIVSERIVSEKKGHAYSWRRVLTYGPGWWAAVGSYSTSYGIYMILIWLPIYLTDYKHIPYAHVGWLTALPYVAGAAGGFIMGPWSSRLGRRGRMFAGRTVLPAVCAIAAGLAFVAIDAASPLWLILALMMISAFGVQVANGIWGAAAIDLYPEEAHMGAQLIVGFGSLNAIVAPLVTGLLIAATHNFFTAFLVGGGLPVVIGLLMLLFFRVRPLAADESVHQPEVQALS